MSTASDDPPACDREVFEKGLGVAALDARMHAAEAWVKKVAAASGQRVDWHYSGGVANVLYLGDYAKVTQAIEQLKGELDGRIMRIFPPESHGLYRAGDVLPDGVIGVDSSGIV